MKSQICVIVLILTLTGCGSSSVVMPINMSAKSSIDEFNREIYNEEVIVLLNDGSQTHGKQFRVDYDSASWREIESERHFHVPVAAIQTVSTDPNRFVGGLIGIGAGAAGGALIGWRIADGIDASSDSKSLTVAGGTAGGAIVGGLIGTFVGMAMVRSSAYNFRDSLASK
jgi:hypothetical protein